MDETATGDEMLLISGQQQGLGIFSLAVPLASFIEYNPAASAFAQVFAWDTKKNKVD